MSSAGAGQKAWKTRRRTQARTDFGRMLANGTIVEGIQHNVKIEIKHEGIILGEIQTVALYFENGQRVAIVRKSGNDDLDVLHGRLLRAFYSIEARHS